MPSAVLEIETAALWYNSQQTGLGRRFAQAVKTEIRFVCNNPHAFPVRYRGIRAIPLKKFPFLIFYKTDDTNKEIIVISVFHVSQNPDKIKDKL
jgi:plasmid stabilization system protein ParE